MRIFANNRKQSGLPPLWEGEPVWPNTDSANVSHLLAKCPVYKPTPLVDATELAAICKVSKIYLKDERKRMELGSFKALGAAYVIAVDAQNACGDNGEKSQGKRVYVAASAGNHGLSIAAGAQVFGVGAVIFLSESVPEPFADRLRSLGADVRRQGKTYEESMEAAKNAATENGWTLLSDSSWAGYLEIPRRVMEGYLQMMAELEREMGEVPTHIFLQAGVGGMAASVAAKARQIWGDEPTIIVVEPDAAPALFEGIGEGRIVETRGPVSSMGRLDCKVASLIALNSLARDADYFMTITEDEALTGIELLAAKGYPTTASGGAGFAGAFAALEGQGERLRLGEQRRILIFLTEGPEQG
jgi:diaminopropionate ammonia-lyase